MKLFAVTVHPQGRSPELGDSTEADEGDEAVLARLDEIQTRLDDIEARQERWSDDVLASAGAIVSVGWGGDVAVERGLMRGDDAVEPEVAELRMSCHQRGFRPRSSPT